MMLFRRLGLLGWRAVLCFIFCTNHALTLAQGARVAVDLASSSKPMYPAPVDIALGLPSELTVQEVAALPRERFIAFDAKVTYPISQDKPLWLRLQVKSGQFALPDWALEIPSVVVDRYDVYQQDAQGSWRKTSAGDHLAHSAWPAPSIRPRFPLESIGAGTQTVFIRVEHLMPSRLSPLIVHADEANHRDLSLILLMGALVGLFSVLMLICLQMAFAYRDWTYFWYAGYLLFTMLTAVAYSGIGQYFLWPQATKFASDALVCFELIAFVFNMQFVNAMFGSRLGSMHGWITRLLVAACTLYVLHILLGAEYANSVLVFMALVVVSCVFIVGTAVLAWRKNIPYSGYWLLIYGPFLTSIALASLENAGQISMPWLPPNLPLVTIMMEAMAMMFCLNAFSRESQAQAVREQAMAQRDPLTGFLNESHFMQAAAKAWQRAGHSARDITLAYVQVESDEADLNVVQFEALISRSVRKVRIAMGERDDFGRIGRNILGISMPDVEPGDLLYARLSRLVALEPAQISAGSTVHSLRLTLAVASWRINSQDFGSIDQQLRALLAKDTEAMPRVIRFLEPQS